MQAFKLIIIKIIQYLSLFFLVVFFSDTMELFQNKDKLGVAFIVFVVHILMVYLLLKWMSKYNISYPGKYFIYGLLSLMTIVFLLMSLIIITGQTSASKTTGGIIITLSSLASLFFWFNFDVINKLRREKVSKSKGKYRRK
ncbi:hypothetical protein [Pseudalkalibacillus decolorationis]|uniref:hypothetical protein n=1 Tax=Pseudalkalibacillus decolorationis TaxID=163879 RepID=UPI002148CB9C|nr:hypothetical protein [Pseudalkalibacillus decolorationis]